MANGDFFIASTGFCRKDGEYSFADVVRIVEDGQPKLALKGVKWRDIEYELAMSYNAIQHKNLLLKHSRDRIESLLKQLTAQRDAMVRLHLRIGSLEAELRKTGP